MSVVVDVGPATVAEALVSAAQRLKEAGLSNAEVEAKELVARALGAGRKVLDLRRGERWPAPAHVYLQSLLSSRVSRVPLAYVLGEWDFLDMTLTVTPDVLIPRPETEELFQWLAEDPFGDPFGSFSSRSAVDVGTGAGGLALAMARRWPSIHVTAIDLSAPALAVARWNAQRHGVAGRITFRLGDLLEGISDAGLDLVVANLPYVASSEMAGLSPEVRKEPARALDGGIDGLDLLRRLIPQSFRALRPGGRLFLEVGLGQTAIVKQEMMRAGFSDVDVKQDFAGIERFLRGVR